MNLTTLHYFHYQNSSPNSYISFPVSCNDLMGVFMSTYAYLQVHLQHRTMTPLKPKSAHISLLLKLHRRLPITYVIKTNVLTVVYKTSHNQVPFYILDVICSPSCSVYSNQICFFTILQACKVCSFLSVFVLESYSLIYF